MGTFVDESRAKICAFFVLSFRLWIRDCARARKREEGTN
jgi:hypothetical protein